MLTPRYPNITADVCLLKRREVVDGRLWLSKGLYILIIILIKDTFTNFVDRFLIN